VDEPNELRARRRLLAALAATTLAGAGAGVYLLRAAPGAPPLPAYTLAFEGADDSIRGDPAPAAGAAPTLTEGTPLTMEARPGAPVVGPVDARAFARCGGRDLEIMHGIDVSAAGAARLSGSVAELLGSVEGECDLLLAVGRPGALPTTPDAAAGALDQSGGATRVVLRQRIRVRR